MGMAAECVRLQCLVRVAYPNSIGNMKWERKNLVGKTHSSDQYSQFACTDVLDLRSAQAAEHLGEIGNRD